MSIIRKKLEGKTTKLTGERMPIKDHPADLNYYTDGGFYNVPIEIINPNPNQPRKYFDTEALEELTQSVKQKGVLQPVIITMDSNRNVHLVAGERRYRAAKTAGLEKIPAVFTTGNTTEIALIENIQREDLKPLEEAEALMRLMDEYSYTQEQLANVIGKNRTTITASLSLNKLPDEIKKECARAHIYPKRLLVEVVRQETPEAMISLFNQIKDNNLKSSDVRKITKKKSDVPQKTPTGVALERVIGLNKSLGKLDMSTAESHERSPLSA